jgi:tRNA pseudouridine synthase B
MYNTLLVNEENKIPLKYLEKLKLISFKENNNTYSLEEETYNAYLKLKKKEKLTIISGYSNKGLNSYETTGKVLKIKEKIDKEVLAKYGFIKMDKYIRYVGLVPAKIMYENKLKLEEYLNGSYAILVNKKRDMTSFDVVSKISKLFGIKKAGHTGTLDPLAEGLMVILLGKATRLSLDITSKYKEYIAGVYLGYETDTYDITGKTTKVKEVPKNIDIEKTLSTYNKTYMQEVPIYSAVKVNGKKLYEYARQNLEVSLPKKEVTIKDIKLLEEEKNMFTFKATVSKGCYIRSLIRDISISLNTLGTMTSLKRTKIDNLKLKDAYTIDEIEKAKFKLLEIDTLFSYPKIKVNKELLSKIKNGSKLENIYNIEDKVIFIDNKSNVKAIYYNDNNILKVYKNLI